MRIRAAAIAILATASLAHADVRTREETAAVSMSYTPWELRFPGAGWMLEQQRRAGDGGQLYYMLTNARRNLIASFYLEPAYKCDPGDACRRKFWANPGPGYTKPGNERFFDHGPFAVVEFTTELGDLVQRHWSAHAVHDGVWIDVHLSNVGAKDFAEFAAFGSELAIGQKAACPECLATRGLPRQESSVLFGKARGGDPGAVERLRSLADDGDAEAQFMLARLHSWGAPQVQQDERQSIALTRKAAEQGHAEAQSNLAYFYVSGRGLDAKQPELAVEWWTRAADQGFAPAQYSLANFYAMDGRQRDPTKAFALMQKAAAQGLAAAQVSLGTAYMRAEGTPRSLNDARDWYLKATRQGNEGAMVNMAALYAVAAVGDPKFYDLAVTLLREPLLAGNKRAQDLRQKICADSPASCARK